MPFSIERNDLALMDVDAVVVTANERLQITGGSGLAVAAAAGRKELQEACARIGSCPTGSAVVTPGFALPARHIVHVVGPVWSDGSHGERRLLEQAYASALEAAAGVEAQSVALPLISSGSYGAPPEVSFAIALGQVRAFLETHDMDVRIVLYNRRAVISGMALYGEIAQYIDDRYVDEHRLERRREESARSYGAPPQAAALPPEARRPEPHESKRQGFFAGLGERLARHRDAGEHEKREAPDDLEDIVLYGDVPDAMLAEADEEEAFFDAAPAAARMPAMQPAAAPGTLDDWLREMDAPFSTMLLRLIDQRGLTDVQVYKRANMSRQLFSKIRSDAAYRPAKKTVLALAVALELSLDETEDLLRRAGFALSNSSKADMIVEYFIVRGNHDIFAINEALYAFDQPLL